MQVKLKRHKTDASLVCLHMGSSAARLEYAVGVSTCVRPSPEIYCHKAGRPFVGCELLRLQGVFAGDFSKPKEVSELSEGLARDMAGNAFTTCVLQASLLASMVSNSVWRCMGHGVKSRSGGPSTGPAAQKRNSRKRKVEEAELPETPDTNNGKGKRKRPAEELLGLQKGQVDVCCNLFVVLLFYLLYPHARNNCTRGQVAVCCICSFVLLFYLLYPYRGCDSHNSLELWTLSELENQHVGVIVYKRAKSVS